MYSFMSSYTPTMENSKNNSLRYFISIIGKIPIIRCNFHYLNYFFFTYVDLPSTSTLSNITTETFAT